MPALLVPGGWRRDHLVEQQHEERLKLQRLRAKSALVSAELLEQQKRVKLLQYEVLARRPGPGAGGRARMMLCADGPV